MKEPIVSTDLQRKLTLLDISISERIWSVIWAGQNIRVHPSAERLYEAVEDEASRQERSFGKRRIFALQQEFSQEEEEVFAEVVDAALLAMWELTLLQADKNPGNQAGYLQFSQASCAMLTNFPYTHNRVQHLDFAISCHNHLLQFMTEEDPDRESPIEPNLDRLREERALLTPDVQIRHAPVPVM